MVGLVVLLIGIPEIDIDEYLPPIPKPVECSALMRDFPTYLLPFDDEQVLVYWERDGGTKRVEIKPGYLVSECEILRQMNQAVVTKRLKAEVTALRTLRTKEFDLWRLMEQQYRQEIAQLNGPTDWLERHRLTIGIAIGAITTATILLVSDRLIPER